MTEKICPHMRAAMLVTLGFPNTPFIWGDVKNGKYVECYPDCQLWDNGDCGLKVARGDRYKLMWEALRAYCVDSDTPKDVMSLMRRMDKIEAEMGG